MIYLRGPMRPLINVTTRKDVDKNQRIANINYSSDNQKKTINSQIKMA